MSYDASWAHVSVDEVPQVKTKPPGPKSQAIHNRASEYMKGYSSQARLFPVAFCEGKGVTLTDVDGNVYIDLSSGIYVTGLGHCHPRVSEAVARYARTLMNCHDFSTPIKMELLEKLAEISMGDLNGVQFYDSGTTAVEAGLRVMRAASNKYEFVSFYRDFHGKTMGSVGLAVTKPVYGPTRTPGFYLVPRPNCYRCPFKLSYPDCGIHCADFVRMAIEQETAGLVAGVVLEPIQGWAGTVIPPDEFIPRLRQICDDMGIMLMADEVLTGMARTGRMFCMQHWDTIPDVMTLGKGLGNGFPVTAMLVSDKYKDAVEKISASTSYGGNPMACAAALACIEVIQEENLCQRSAELGEFFLERLLRMQDEHQIIGNVRGKGCLLGIELVKDKNTKEPFDEAGVLTYTKAFEKGIAWIPAGHILRLSPPMIMEKDIAAKALDIIDEAIWETEKELGYTG